MHQYTNNLVVQAGVNIAAIVGTLQADYTSFPYLGETSERIARREALLGVSMTGMMERPDIAFDGELQRRIAALILAVNASVAARLGIDEASLRASGNAGFAFMGPADRPALVIRGEPGESAAAKVLEARIYGTPIEALCGHVWVPSRDPRSLPVCQKCKDVYGMYREFNDGLNEQPDE